MSPLFPETRESLVSVLASGEPGDRARAFDVVVRAYRAPVIALVRRRWGLEEADAEDAVHDFFARALEKEWLARYDASKGKFRTFLRSCVYAFVAGEHRAGRRLKRGGGAVHEPLDAASASVDGERAMDELLEREWRRSVLGMAVEALRDECTAVGREATFAVFQRYDLEGADGGERPTYARLAAELSLPVTQVTNYLAWARRRFRAHVLGTLRALAGNEDEYRDDVRAMLGADVS
jgi:DNA-directed RNA polymerase specialized sigma24 family protein